MALTEAPYNKCGSLALHRWDRVTTMKPIKLIAGTLVYVGYSNFKSTSRVQWQELNGEKTYWMSMTDLDKCFNRIVQGRLTGEFEVVKRGNCYTIKLKEEWL